MTKNKLTEAQAHDEFGAYLERHCHHQSERAALGATLGALAKGIVEIAALTNAGPLAGKLGEDVTATTSQRDIPKLLDIRTHEILRNALAKAPVRYVASEESDAIEELDESGSLAVAVDPLDGSSNIDVNISIGTIFSISPASPDSAEASFFRSGRHQLAAGYAIYGPHTALLLSLGAGVDLFVLGTDDHFHLVKEALRIPEATHEYAINASNYRRWYEPVRRFIDDCTAGVEGPRGRDFNMRWIASLVAETHRIFQRGGVFLYPGDTRPDYARGRLRLLYEAAPIAFLVEQAGGAATDGVMAILDLKPTQLHDRTPLVFGSKNKVELIARYHQDPTFHISGSPLFGQRGLFRG